MDEKALRQSFAEIIECTGMAIGLVVSALARRGDAQQLTEDLRATLKAADATGHPKLAIRLATHALAAAEAESVLQRKATH